MEMMLQSALYLEILVFLALHSLSTDLKRVKVGKYDALFNDAASIAAWYIAP